MRDTLLAYLLIMTVAACAAGSQARPAAPVLATSPIVRHAWGTWQVTLSTDSVDVSAEAAARGKREVWRRFHPPMTVRGTVVITDTAVDRREVAAWLTFAVPLDSVPSPMLRSVMQGRRLASVLVIGDSMAFGLPYNVADCCAALQLSWTGEAWTGIWWTAGVGGLTAAGRVRLERQRSGP